MITDEYNVSILAANRWFFFSVICRPYRKDKTIVKSAVLSITLYNL